MFNFKTIPQWVVWRQEKRAGNLTKIPYSPITGNMASSTDPNTWSDYFTAKKYKMENDAFLFNGIGFVLPLDSSILGVDLDKCLNEKNEIENPIFKQFFEESDTYTEISPSGNGLHLFFETEQGFNLEANRSKKCPNFECYSTGRYFTFTENIYQGKNEVRRMSHLELFNLLKITGYPWKNKINSVEINATSISEFEVLQRMFSAKNGEKIKALYNGNTSDYNNDDSAADMALCMHLAFWTQKDREKIRLLWLNSPLGRREKTQKRKDYQDMTIQRALESVSETYSYLGSEGKKTVDSLNLMKNSKGIPVQNLTNIFEIIKNDDFLSQSIRFNSFNNENEVNLGTKYEEKEWHPYEKSDISLITLHIQRNYPFFDRVPKEQVEDALLVFARDNIKNPLIDWIASLEWDGTHRLDHWLHYVYGVENNPYHSAVGANWFKGLVKRIIYPGSRFDYVLILEGPQGWKKSTSLHTIGKEYHVETTITPENKDFFMILKSNVIVEFSEGHTMNRADTRLLKSVVTMVEDQFRIPFGRSIQRFPRRCVFAMTTNENQYLRDETGNRRFLPVEVKKIADIEWLEANIEQLYAESYERAIIKNEIYWEFTSDTASIQESKMIENPYSEKLITWYGKIPKEQRITDGITALEAYREVWQNGFNREMNTSQAIQITSLFTNLLKLKKKRKMIEGSQKNRWFPTEETLKIIGEEEENTEIN